MLTFPRKTFALLVCLNLLVPRLAMASEASAGNLVIVADTRGLSGWAAWLANLYNLSHIQFTLFTVIAIPVAGLILGSLADLVMRRIGLDLKSRDLAEH